MLPYEYRIPRLQRTIMCHMYLEIAQYLWNKLVHLYQCNLNILADTDPCARTKRKQILLHLKIHSLALEPPLRAELCCVVAKNLGIVLYRMRIDADNVARGDTLTLQ